MFDRLRAVKLHEGEDSPVASFKELTRSQKRLIEPPLEMETGYVLDFSTRTIEEFFEDEFGIEFYSDQYSFYGTSKAKILRAILEERSAEEAALILRAIWQHRATLPPDYSAFGSTSAEEKQMESNFFKVVSLLEEDTQPSNNDIFVRHATNDNSLGTLLAEIQRYLREDQYPPAIDRLHTYCVKKLRFLLKSHGENVDASIPLHSLMGQYAKGLKNRGLISDISFQLLRNCIPVLEILNTARNNESLAHDNPLVEAHDAKHVFDAVCTALRFIKSNDKNFGQ